MAGSDVPLSLGVGPGVGVGVGVGDGPPPSPAGARLAALVIGADGRIRNAGGAARSLLGEDAASLRGRTLIEAVVPDDRDALLAAMSQVLVDGEDEHLTVRSGAALGLAIPLQVTLCLVTGDEGDVLVASFSPADGAHPVHDLLAARDDETTAITISDARGHLRYVSGGVTALLCWSPDDIVARGIRGLVARHDLDRFLATGAALRAEPGGVASAVVQMARPDGTMTWVRVIGMNLLDDPAVAGVVTALADGTDDVRAQQRERARVLVEHEVLAPGDDRSLIWRPDGIISFVGEGVASIVGVPAETLLGRPDLGYVADVDRPDLDRAFTRALNDARLRPSVRYRIRRADSEQRWIRADLVNRVDHPYVGGVLVQLDDITERVEADDAVRASERRFRKLVQNSGDVLVILGLDRTVRWVGPSIEAVLGYTPSAVVGLPGSSLVEPDDLAPARAHIQAVRAGGPVPNHFVVRSRHADGGLRHLSVTAANLTDDPDIEGVVLAGRDITAQVEAEAARARLTLALEASTDLVGMATRGDERVTVNRAAARLLGLDEAHTTDIPTIWARVPPWVQHRFWDEVLPALEAGGLWEGELAVHDGEGDAVPISVVLVALNGDDGAVETVAVVARDISERKAFQDQLEHQATHDPLTGMPNRTLLLDRLRVAGRRAERQSSLTAVLFLDLDNFKLINDSLGHSSGDLLLVQVARRIEGAVRPGDTVARFGGDEFAVLCEDLVDGDEAVTIAARIEAAVAGPMTLDGIEVMVTVSIGVATSAGDQPAEVLMRDSDSAMYQAKARGRSRTEVFDSAMHVRALDRLELETSLRRVLDRHEMRVVYQPQIDLRTGRINGVEGLVRWEHPERGLLLPGDFLPIAEETGLIVPIGNWITATACRALARLSHLHPEAGPLVMSVNLSARQLASAHLLDDVAAIVADAGLDAAALMLEVTETDLMDVEASGEALTRMHELGVGVAVDDFGTGWSSLRYLRQFPVDVLKIDRSFVVGLGHDPEDEAIVAAVIDLAHALGLRAVAEGVEEPIHLERLRALGCDAAQGWLLGRPMAEADIDALLEAQG